MFEPNTVVLLNTDNSILLIVYLGTVIKRSLTSPFFTLGEAVLTSFTTLKSVFTTARFVEIAFIFA